jgi:autotransporter-associated beta strand protein/T5SS/PEP-CTERM-associated repeat protein
MPVPFLPCRHGGSCRNAASAGSLASMVACLLISVAWRSTVQAQTTLDSGTTTVTSGTDFGSSLIVALSDTAALEVLGGIATNGSALIGYSRSSVGTVAVTGGTWASSSNVNVGFNGSGTLDVNGGRVTSFATYILAGDMPNGTGTVTVTAGELVSDTRLVVGYTGTGTLNVNGGRVSNAEGYVGSGFNRTGTAIVTSGTWANSSLLVVGRGGPGILNVNGGTVTSGDCIVGEFASSVGSVAVTSGTLTTSGNLEVGRDGIGTLILDGGLVSVVGTLSTGVSGTVSLSAEGALSTSSIVNNGSFMFTGSSAATFASAISGTGRVVKQGPGALILSATSTFTGPTSVNAGRLSVNGALGNTALTVANAAELGGAGSIVGAIAVLSGGTLAPGNSIDSLSGGATSFAAGSSFGYEVDSSLLGSLGTAADLLVVSGNLDIASGALLSFADITSGGVQPFVDDTTVFAMINYSGIWNGGLFSFNGTPLADGSRFSVGSQYWRIDYDYTYDTASPSTIRPLNYQSDYLPSSGTQTFVTVTAVPEPGAFALAGLGVGLATVAFRRRA